MAEISIMMMFIASKASEPIPTEIQAFDDHIKPTVIIMPTLTAGGIREAEIATPTSADISPLVTDTATAAPENIAIPTSSGENPPRRVISVCMPAIRLSSTT